MIRGYLAELESRHPLADVDVADSALARQAEMETE